MKILHVCLCGPYTDGYSYQDNLLPLKHKTMGNDVMLICSVNSYNGKGERVQLDQSKYVDENGLVVVRIPFLLGLGLMEHFGVFKGLYRQLEMFSPDIIFVHGVQFVGLIEILKYKRKHFSTKIYIDNHCDFINAKIMNWRYALVHKYIYGLTTRRFVPYVEKFWGVTQMRMDYLEKVYGVPKANIDLLVMGGDEQKIHREKREFIRSQLKEKYKIDGKSHIIISGGKIDKLKNIHLLLEAMSMIPDSVLLVFGEPIKDFRSEYEELSKKPNVRAIGWIKSYEAYDLFVASDLVVFPGTHSVLWEQAVASGAVSVFKYYEGMTHVDVGGNCRFLHKETAVEIAEVVNDIFDSQSNYEKMNDVAVRVGMKTFAYSEIARRAIGLTNNNCARTDD